MLIRDRQLSDLAADRTLGRIVEVICAGYPAARATLASEEGRRILREQYSKANTYGISSELGKARYIITAWLLGSDFDVRFPAMREILNNPAVPPDGKAEALEQFTTAVLETLERHP